MFNRGRYELQMFDTRSKMLVLQTRYILKVNALNAFSWHKRITSTGFKYLLIDLKTGAEVEPDITYKLLKGPNV